MRVIKFGMAAIAALTIVGGAPTAATAAALVGPAPPYNCESGTRHDRYQGAWVHCNSGYGHARAWAECWNELTFKKTRIYGPWVSVNQTSVAWCTASYPARVTYGYNTRAL